MTGSLSDRFHVATDRAATGGPERYHDQLKDRGKLFVRDRVDLLCDPGSFVEDGLLANAETEDHGADAVVTGRGTIDGRPVMVIANDPTVKAGSWGRLTVEKIIRALEAAYDEWLPVFFLVDAARGRSSTTRFGSPGVSHRSAVSSARRPRAGPTSRRSVTLW